MGSLLQSLNPVYIKKIYLKIWRLRDETGKNQEKRVPTSKTYHASTILSEINMNDISFFSAQQFIEGQSIAIEFQIPKKFTIHAEVEYCRNYAMKKQIISEKELPFRGRGRFVFANSEDKNTLRQFVSSIEAPEKNKKKVVFQNALNPDQENHLDKKAS